MRCCRPRWSLLMRGRRARAQGGCVVFKIVPMEGSTLVNGEPQKRAAEMLAEVEIALALSALRGPVGARPP